MKHNLDHCREIFKDYVIAAYFFNARGDSLEKTPLGMLRSLTYQLLDQDPLLYERFIPMFRDKQKKHKIWEWREGELKKFLLSQVKTCQSTPLLFLIDALDECNEPEVRKVVEFLELLSIYAIDANVALHICLSSRHYPTVSMKKRLELVVEEEKEHAGDISIYVRDKLTERDKEIEKDILNKASGIFMWVILVVAMLNQAYDRGKVEAMHQTLREVPSDLEEVFRTLLSEDNPDKDETILMLQWVLFNKRPLKPEELYFATIAGTDTQNLRAWNRSKVTSDVIRRRITSSSKGLIEIRKGGEETVQFIHESVNDFLLRNKRLETLDSGLESNAIGVSHDRLRACCMSYLMIEELPSAKDKLHVKELRLSYPFLEYASTYVLDHAEKAQAKSILQMDFMQCLQQPHGEFERLRRFHNAFEEDLFSRCGRGASLLYMLSLHGHDELVKVVLRDKGVDVNVQGGLYGNALQAASYKENENIVVMLIEKGANVNAQGGILDTALAAASVEGNEEITTMLLEKGTDVNAQGGFYGTALAVASAVGEEKIVTMLLEKGADINAQGGFHGTALVAASAEGKDDIVTMLLEKGADVNAQGGFFGTALVAASAEGKEKIVTMLLEKGADINAQGGIYGTALQAASAEGKEEIVAILLEKGADVNAQGEFYGNALQAASVTGNDEIVTMLLEKGADVNAQGGFYGNALQAALAEGNEEIVTTLLEKRADINTRDELYGNVLQATSAEGNEEAVAVLLREGAEVNTKGGIYNNALQAASAKGYEGIVTMLLEKGADVNAQGGLYGNALQAASAEGNEEIVAILLEKGAEVNAKGGIYGKALQAASAKGYEEIVMMLLEKGADVNAQGGLYGNALHMASLTGKEEIVAILLEKGAEVNTQGGVLGNVLWAAYSSEKEEIVAMLLEKGADFNAQGGVAGDTLLAASATEKEEIVAILLEKGADISHPQWRTVLNRQLDTAHHLTKVIVLLITTFFVELWKQLFEKLSRKSS